MRESFVEKSVCVYAANRGWTTIKLAGPGDRGKPDRMFLKAGARLMFIEFKAPGKRPTKLQQSFLDKLWDMGFKVYVIDHPDQAAEVFGE